MDTSGIDYNKHRDLKTYLEDAIKKRYESQYDEYYKLFVFGDACRKANGYGFLDEKHACLFNGHDDITISHEVCHCLGLNHTFDFTNPNRNIVAYKYAKTNNMLDYSHLVNIKRNSLFYWQWKKINPQIK